jgi:hypothetical protein
MKERFRIGKKHDSIAVESEPSTSGDPSGDDGGNRKQPQPGPPTCESEATRSFRRRAKDSRTPRVAGPPPLHGNIRIVAALRSPQRRPSPRRCSVKRRTANLISHEIGTGSVNSRTVSMLGDESHGSIAADMVAPTRGYPLRGGLLTRRVMPYLIFGNRLSR